MIRTKQNSRVEVVEKFYNEIPLWIKNYRPSHTKFRFDQRFPQRFLAIFFSTPTSFLAKQIGSFRLSPGGNGKENCLFASFSLFTLFSNFMHYLFSPHTILEQQDKNWTINLCVQSLFRHVICISCIQSISFQKLA